jgi:hypothetical protein
VVVHPLGLSASSWYAYARAAQCQLQGPRHPERAASGPSTAWDCRVARGLAAAPAPACVNTTSNYLCSFRTAEFNFTPGQPLGARCGENDPHGLAL